MSTPRARRIGWLPYVAMAVVLAVAIGVGGSGGAAPTASERVFDLSRAIACPQCDGQAVAESSSPVAAEIRRDLAVRVDAGESDEQIRDYYASRYGRQVLLRPPAEGVAGLVWVLPVLAAAGGLAVLVVVGRRWTARDRHATADDEALVAAALSEGDR